MLLKSVTPPPVHAKQRLLDDCGRLIEYVAREPLRLLTIVGDGPFKFRRTFFAAMREGDHMAVDENVANAVFHCLCLQVQVQFGDAPVGAVLDSLEVHETKPPTEREIAEGWQIESASSEEGRKFLFGDKSIDEVLREIADPDAPATVQREEP